MKKKNLYVLIVLLVLSGFSARESRGQGQAATAGTPSKPTIVIVHGAWGGVPAVAACPCPLLSRALKPLSTSKTIRTYRFFFFIFFPVLWCF